MNCSEAVEFRQSTGLHIVMAWQIILSLLSIVANILLLWLSKRYVFFHENFRILVMASLIANLIHAVANAANQGFHLFKLFTAITDCDLMVSQLTCLLFRYPPLVCITAFVFVHGCMLVERVIAARQREKYHFMGRKISVFMVILMTFCCLSSTALRLQRFPRSSYTAVCLAMTKETYFPLISGCMILACVEIICLAAYISLRCMNKKLLKNRIYSLNERFSLKENILALKLLGPLFCLTFITLVLFALSNLLIFGLLQDRLSSQTIMFLHGFAYIIPFYTLACPIMLLFILKKYEKVTRKVIAQQLHLAKKDERVVYFDTYNKMWR